MALKFPTCTGAAVGGGGGGGGAAQGFARGWQYLDMASATYVPAVHYDGGGNPYNKVVSSSDTGSQWAVEVHADKFATKPTVGGVAKDTGIIGWGSYWFWDLGNADDLDWDSTNKIILKLELKGSFFSVDNKNCMVTIGLAQIPNGTDMHAGTSWVAAGGFSNDTVRHANGSLQPDIRHALKTGGNAYTVSSMLSGADGSPSTAIVEIVRHGDRVLTTQTTIYRPSPIGGARKEAVSYADSNYQIVDANLKMFVQVGRTGSSSTATTITFAPSYLASTEKVETDWGI